MLPCWCAQLVVSLFKILQSLLLIAPSPPTLLKWLIFWRGVTRFHNVTIIITHRVGQSIAIYMFDCKMFLMFNLIALCFHRLKITANNFCSKNLGKSWNFKTGTLLLYYKTSDSRTCEGRKTICLAFKENWSKLIYFCWIFPDTINHYPIMIYIM